MLAAVEVCRTSARTLETISMQTTELRRRALSSRPLNLRAARGESLTAQTCSRYANAKLAVSTLHAHAAMPATRIQQQEGLPSGS